MIIPSMVLDTYEEPKSDELNFRRVGDMIYLLDKAFNSVVVNEQCYKWKISNRASKFQAHHFYLVEITRIITPRCTASLYWRN